MAVECRQRQPDFNLFGDAGVPLDADPRAQQRNVRIVERAQHLFHGRQARRGVRPREIDARDRRPQRPSQSIVRADLREVAA